MAAAEDIHYCMTAAGDIHCCMAAETEDNPYSSADCTAVKIGGILHSSADCTDPVDCTVLVDCTVRAAETTAVQ